MRVGHQQCHEWWKIQFARWRELLLRSDWGRGGWPVLKCAATEWGSDCSECPQFNPISAPTTPQNLHSMLSGQRTKYTGTEFPYNSKSSLVLWSTTAASALLCMSGKTLSSCSPQKLKCNGPITKMSFDWLQFCCYDAVALGGDQKTFAPAGKKVRLIF